MGLRVLCVTPWFPNTPNDGKFNFILHSLRSLVAAGYQVQVLVTRPWVPRLLASVNEDWAHAKGPLRLSEFGDALQVELIRYPSIPRYILSDYADALYQLGVGARLARLIEEREIQIVHAHTERAGIGAVAVAKAHGVPAVVTLHGISTAPQLLNTHAKRARLRACLNAATRVVLVGEPLRSYFSPIAGGDTNFRVVPNGFFVHGVTRVQQASVGVCHFVSVANLQEGKGIDLNLRALSQLDVAGLTQWRYEIVGAGPERAALESLAGQLGLRSKVTFHGALAHDAAMQVLAQGDVFTLPSYREAFGVAYLEAMACGLLTIGVSGQGPDAFIEHLRTGLLVEPRDVESLSRAMAFAIEHPGESARIAVAGRAYVRAEFTWSRHADKLSAVYHEAIGS